MIEIESLDHIVLRVRDLDRAMAFYRDILGLPIEALDEYRAGTRPFVSARVSPTAIIDLVPDPSYEPGASGFLHFCLHLRNGDFAELIPWLRQKGAELIEDEPMLRRSARGTGPALYLRDPDGYVVELTRA